MHIEIQVALNFVISYLYNKLPRRRVNIFGEELEKALKDKFQGHWYPEKPCKGSAFRCIKTGDPIDPVLERAAHESGVPISDILENLPHELSVWVDPGEVSYRIGEKGAFKILYSENNDNLEDNTSADREVNKTFHSETHGFRPIDVISSSITNLNLSPKISPQSGSSPHSTSSTSPTYKNSPNPSAAIVANGHGHHVNGSGGGGGTAAGNNSAFMQRSQQQLTFTTATFAQTKFGSTKLKTSSKRTTSNSAYRMSPTEFSNYIKQRAMQQQIHHSHGAGGSQPNHFGPIGPISPARSISPNPLSLAMNSSESYYLPPNVYNTGPYGAPPNIFDYTHDSLYGPSSANGNHNKYNSYLDPQALYGLGNAAQQPQPQQAQSPQQQQQQQQKITTPNGITTAAVAAAVGATMSAPQAPPQLSQSQQLQQSNQQQLSPLQPLKNGKTKLYDAKDIGIIENNTKVNGIINGIHAMDSIERGRSPAHNANVANAAPTSANAAAAAAVVSSVVTGATNANVQNSSIADNGAGNNQESNSSKLIDGLNSFYSNATGSYQQLLVAN